MISGPLHHFQLSDFYNRSFDEKKTCQNELGTDKFNVTLHGILCKSFLISISDFKHLVIMHETCNMGVKQRTPNWQVLSQILWPKFFPTSCSDTNGFKQCPSCSLSKSQRSNAMLSSVHCFSDTHHY